MFSFDAKRLDNNEGLKAVWLYQQIKLSSSGQFDSSPATSKLFLGSKSLQTITVEPYLIDLYMIKFTMTFIMKLGMDLRMTLRMTFKTGDFKVYPRRILIGTSFNI